MAARHEQLLQRIASLYTLWGFLPASWQAVVVAGASLVTGYFGFQQGGIFWALIGASVVFAFTMMGLTLGAVLTRMLSVFERLSVAQIGIAQAALRQDKDGRNKKSWTINGLTLDCYLRNHSQQILYFKLKRATHSMAGKTVVPRISEMVHIVPPQESQKVTFATLPDIKLEGESLEGHLDLEILYGPGREDLRYQLIYESAPMMSVSIDKQGQGQLGLNVPILKHLHARAQKFS